MNLSRTKNTVYNTVVGLLYLAIHTIYSFVLTSIIINHFGSASNGLVSSIKQILTYASLVDFGLGAACIMSYYGPLSRDNKEEIKNVFIKSKKFFHMIGGTYFCILLLLSYIYPLIIDIEYSKSYVTLVFFTVGFSRGFSYFAIEKYKCIFTADQKNWIEQISLIIVDIIAIALVLIFVKTGIADSVLKIEILISVLVILQYLYYCFIFRKCYPWIYNKEIVPAGEKQPIKQVKATFVHMISSTISYNTDIILLTIVRSLVEVSIYSVYSMIFAIANSFFAAFTKGIESSFGNLYNKDKKQFNSLFEKYEYGYIILDTIILCIVLLVLKSFVELYTKAEVTVSYWNYSIALAFFLNTFFNNVRNPHAMAIRVSENYKTTQNIFVMEAIINLSISLVLVKPLGIVGVLIGTMASVIIRNIYVIGFIYKNILDKSILSIVKLLAINCIPIVICVLFTDNPPLGLSINYLSLLRDLIFYSLCVCILVICTNSLLNFKKFRELIQTAVASLHHIALKK